MTKRDLAVVACTLAFLGGLAFAQTKTTLVTGNSIPAKKWDAFCADAIGSGVKDDTAEGARQEAGWNTVLKRYGEGGWEPYQMLGDAKHISGVCFRRALQ